MRCRSSGLSCPCSQQAGCGPEVGNQGLAQPDQPDQPSVHDWRNALRPPRRRLNPKAVPALRMDRGPRPGATPHSPAQPSAAAMTSSRASRDNPSRARSRSETAWNPGPSSEPNSCTSTGATRGRSPDSPLSPLPASGGAAAPVPLFTHPVPHAADLHVHLFRHCLTWWRRRSRASTSRAQCRRQCS